MDMFLRGKISPRPKEIRPIQHIHQWKAHTDEK